MDKSDLFTMNPNGFDVSVDGDEYEDITFHVSNCEDEDTAVNCVWEFIRMLANEVDKGEE